jgi:hypothetical protein
MGHGRFPSFEARKSTHLRVNAIAFIPGMTRHGAKTLVFFPRMVAMHLPH